MANRRDFLRSGLSYKTEDQVEFNKYTALEFKRKDKLVKYRVARIRFVKAESEVERAGMELILATIRSEISWSDYKKKITNI